MNYIVPIDPEDAKLAALVSRVERGEEVVVTRHGRAVARLVAVPIAEPVRYGDLSHLRIADDLSIPPDILNDFEAGGAP